MFLNYGVVCLSIQCCEEVLKNRRTPGNIFNRCYTAYMYITVVSGKPHKNVSIDKSANKASNI